MIEHVDGIIIGGSWYQGQVHYDGRPQGQTLYADTEAELIEKAKAIKTDLFDRLGGHPCYLYQDDSKWELRIYP